MATIVTGVQGGAGFSLPSGTGLRAGRRVGQAVSPAQPAERKIIAHGASRGIVVQLSRAPERGVRQLRHDFEAPVPQQQVLPSPPQNRAVAVLDRKSTRL